MNLPISRHEDNRRILIEWVKDIPVKSVKTIYVKDKLPLGNHYHLEKDEIFYMMKGKGNYTLKNLKGKVIKRDWLFEGECIMVNRGTVHTFELFKDSILLEAATEPYDKKDEIPFLD